MILVWEVYKYNSILIHSNTHLFITIKINNWLRFTENVFLFFFVHGVLQEKMYWKIIYCRYVVDDLLQFFLCLTRGCHALTLFIGVGFDVTKKTETNLLSFDSCNDSACERETRHLLWQYFEKQITLHNNVKCKKWKTCLFSLFSKSNNKSFYLRLSLHSNSWELTHAPDCLLHKFFFLFKFVHLFKGNSQNEFTLLCCSVFKLHSVPFAKFPKVIIFTCKTSGS